MRKVCGKEMYRLAKVCRLCGRPVAWRRKVCPECIAAAKAKAGTKRG